MPLVETAADTERSPAVSITASRQFASWLAEQQISLAFTTYQSGKLFLIGLQSDGRLSIFERTFNRAMGLWGDGQSLWMTSLYQVWRFENVLEAGQTHDGYDRLYVPRVGYTTGDIDAHDIAVDACGRAVFANTLFSCVAAVSDCCSFTSLWRPPFISRLAAEDRCHLNGLAMHDGAPRFVTACSRSDVAGGWRARCQHGGCVVDAVTNEIVAEGLSMPHSPRCRDGKLWLLDSGTGFLGYIDIAASGAHKDSTTPMTARTGEFSRVAFCPGYARGLSLHGHFAIIGLSKLRASQTFATGPLQQSLAERDADAWCGIAIVDLRSGDLVHWLRLEGLVQELYDVVALPGVQRPMAIGFKSDEIRRIIHFEDRK
jgi:uncharacterized protein (TIGR03032 family)